MYYNIDDLNWVLLRLQDLATDPAMRTMFERTQVSLNVLAIQMGQPALDREIDKHQQTKTFRDIEQLDEDIKTRLERMTDLGLVARRGNPNFNGLSMYVNPQWPSDHERRFHHAIYLSDSIEKGLYYDITIYHDGTLSWYMENECIYTLLEQAREYMRTKGLL